MVLRLIKELDAEGTIKTPLNGCLGTLARVIFYGPNSLSGDKYKSSQNWNKNTNALKIGLQIQGASKCLRAILAYNLFHWHNLTFSGVF